MENTARKSPMKTGTKVLIGGIAVAVLAVTYFSFFYPPTSTDDVLGTIGAAKKYRSEQITDKDVQLGGEVISEGESVLADEKTVQDLQAAAASYEKSVATINSHPAYAKAVGEQLQRASAALLSTASLAQRLSLTKSAAEGLLAKTGDLNRAMSAALMEKAALNKEMAAEWNSKAMALELSSTAASLDRKFRWALDKNQSTIDNNVAASMQNTVRALYKGAEYANRSSLDRRPVAEMAAMAAELNSVMGNTFDKAPVIDARAAERLLSTASALEQRAAALERQQASLEKRAGLENKPGLDAKAPAR